MRLFKKSISVLLVMAVCLMTIPFTFASAEETTKMIYQVEPGKTGQTAGMDVTTSEPYFVADAGVKTYVREDDDGLYYSTEISAFSGEKYIYFDSGWNESSLPLLGDADVLNKLLDYMQISVDIRIVSEATIDKDISVQLLAYPNANNILHYTDGGVNVSADGQWHTFTRSGTAGSLSGTYLNKVLMITRDIPADLKIEIRNFSVSIKESDKDAINAALEGTDFTYESLTQYVPYVHDNESYMIYQIEPGKVGKTAGTNVTGSCDGMGPSVFQTYVREDENGYYYSTEVGANSGEYSYVDTGWTGETMPLLGNATVLEKLLPYMQISVDARIVSDAELTENVKLQILSMPHYEEFFRYSDDYVPVDGEWHTFTRSGTDGGLAWRFHGTLALDIKNNNDADVKVEFRNLSVSLRGSDKEAINSVLDGTEYSFDDLIKYRVYVHNSSAHNIWQATPEYFGSVNGADVTLEQEYYGALDVYAYDEDEGMYYSVDYNITNENMFAYINTGWHDLKLAWLGETEVINAIMPYMQISAKVRVTGYDNSLTNVQLAINGVNSYELYPGFNMISNRALECDGKWHTITQYGATGDALSWYSGAIFLDITNPDGCNFYLDIKDIRISLREADKDLIDEALANVESEYNSYDKLIKFVTYYKPDTIIWYADSNKADREMDNNCYVNVEPAYDLYSKYDTTAELDLDGAYYRTVMSASGTGSLSENSLVNSGVNHKTRGYGWMNNLDVLNALRPYMQLSFRYRVTGNFISTPQLTLSSANNAMFTGTMAEFDIDGTDYWYEHPYSSLLTDFTDVWRNGYFAPSIYTYDGDLAGEQTIDLADINIAVSSAYREIVNAKLSKIDGIDNIQNFTVGLTIPADKNGNKDYFSLLVASSNVTENDINDDDKFDIKDLVALKKYAAVYAFTPSYILDRIDTDQTGYIDATDLTAIRMSLLNKKINDYIVDVAVNHPGVAEMDATYEMVISDKSGNALNAKDFEWSANFENVTVNGSTITVPYSVRISSKALVVTATNKSKSELSATYTFDFLQYSSNAAFVDEFEGNDIDSNKWSVTDYETEGDIGVADGNLTLTVDPHEIVGVTTEGKFNQTFGSFSARMKFPSNGLSCSAFWLMNYGGYYVDPEYPNNTEGEIDIVEYLSETNCYMSTVHWNGYVENDLYQKSCRFTDTHLLDDPRYIEKPALPVNDDEFHIVSAVWTKDGIYWYVDGQLIFVHTGEGVGQGAGSMFMRLDLNGWAHESFGGKFNEADYPVTLTFDWVKVYELN